MFRVDRETLSVTIGSQLRREGFALDQNAKLRECVLPNCCLIATFDSIAFQPRGG
jgi:hypothetical protein